MKQGRIKSGFTLVEMLIASTIAVLIAASTIGLLNSLTGARKRIEQEMTMVQESRSGVRALESALRNAIQTAGKNEWLLEGIDQEAGGAPADSIRFRTVSLRRLRVDEPESDWREVEFYVQPSEDAEEAGGGGGLMRRLDPTRNLEPDGGGILERVARGVGGLDIQYHDGVEWQEEWLIENTTWPVAIRFSLLVVGGTVEKPVLGSTRRTIGYFVPGEATEVEEGGESVAGGGRS